MQICKKVCYTKNFERKYSSLDCQICFQVEHYGGSVDVMLSYEHNIYTAFIINK